MLTLTGSMYIEGYTVFQDDQNDIDGMQSRIDTVLKNEQQRSSSLVDRLRGMSGQSVSSLDGINKDTSFDQLRSSLPPPPPAPPANQVLSARRFYVLPDKPAIATDPDGKPIFSMIVYRRDEDRLDPSKVPTDDVGGGILTFTVELAVPQDALTKIASKLKTLVAGNSDSPAQVEVTVVQFIQGKVSIAIAGEGTDATGNQFVKSAVGTGDIVGVADNRKAVMVNLTQDGAALMSQIDKLRTLPINVQYQLGYEHRLLGVTLRVWCDVSSSYQLIQTTIHNSSTNDYLGITTARYTTDKIAKATEVMTRQKTCGVEVIPSSSAIDQDTLTALEKFGEDMLQKELDKVVTANPVPESVDRSWLDKWGSDASNTLNFTLDQRMVLVQKYTPSANIQNIFTRGDVADMIAFIDLRTGFFTMLKVPIRVNADFTKLPISHVVVTVTYKSRNPDGSASDRTESFDFTDGGTIQTFLAYANTLDAVAYDWKAEVHYRNTGGGTDDTFTVSRSRVKDRFLIIDVGTLGMISVAFSLGLVDTDKFSKATVSVRYQSTSGQQFGDQFTLDKDTPDHVWTAIIKEQSTGVYDYKVDWYSKADSRIITGSWQSSSNFTCALDAPIKDHIDVSVVCSGNFKDGQGGDPISHVLVALVYADPDNNIHHEGSLDFTDDKQLQHWSADLENPNLRNYQYRFQVVYKGGVVQYFPSSDTTKYFPGQPGFIVVGPTYDLEVTVYPYLLQLAGFPDSERMVQVDLIYASDDGKINTTGSFNFTKESSSPQVWRASTGGKGPQPYSVNVTYFSGQGQVIKAPTQPAAGQAFVVPPLAPAATPR